jgi:aminoglycoside phosphotransferase (APT) family kinase protein
VIRRDLPAGPAQTSAPDELDLLQRLAVQDYPAPRAIAAERDPSYFGRPVLLMERVPGVDAEGMAQADPQMGRFVALELARHLARLHRLDPADLGFKLAQDSACDQVRAYVASWRAWWDQNRVHPSSLVETGFAWLDANVPVDIPQIVTVHGDARVGNMMVDDGRITTLLDWEFAHPGDPNEDLQYAKVYVAPFVSWEDFVSAYAEAGGAPLSEAGARFYDVFRSVRNVVCMEASWKGFVSGAYPSFKLAASVVYKPILAHELAKALRSAQW